MPQNLKALHLVQPEKQMLWNGVVNNQQLKIETGKTDGNLRETQKSFASSDKAQLELEKAAEKKLKDGFRGLTDPSRRADPTRLHVFLARGYTGFLPIDYNADSNQLVVSHNLSTSSALCAISTLNCQSGEWNDVIEFPEFDCNRLKFVSSSQLLLQSDDRIHLLDLETAQYETVVETGSFPHLEFDFKDNWLMYSKPDSIEIIELGSRKSIFSQQVDIEDSYKSECQCHISPSKKLAAYSVHSGELNIVDTQKGSVKTIQSDFPFLNRVRLHPNGDRVSFGEYMSSNWALRTWNLKTMKEESRLRKPNVLQFEIHPSAKWIARRQINRKEVEFVSLSNGKVFKKLYQPFSVKNFEFGFSPDGKFLFVRTDLGFVSLYDVSQLLK